MINVILSEFGDLGVGYDVQITDDRATVGGYISALDAFQEKYVTDCRGCDGCCWERVPLGIADYFWGLGLFNEPCDIGTWLSEVAQLDEIDGVIDLYLKRGEDSACSFLNKEKKECFSHLTRPLVCRTHICLPKSGLALALRSAIVNMLEDELIRRLLTEIVDVGSDGNADCQKALTQVDIADYPANVFSDFSLVELKKDWQNVKIKDIISVDLWQEIYMGK